MNFKDKVALVTGGAAGIGRAAALGFSRYGAKVMVVDRDEAGAAETVELVRSQGGDARYQAADVSRSADVQAYVRATLDAWGRIDCFHNNAGIEGRLAPTWEYDEAVFDQVIAVNLKGVFLGLRHVMPVMIGQESGAVVNTASVAGLEATANMSAYVASKHGVVGLTKAAGAEAMRHGVRVNAVCPGPIRTRMIRDLATQFSGNDPDAAERRYQAVIPSGRFGTAEEVANVALFLCSDLASNVTGAYWTCDGGRTAVGSSMAAGTE